MPGHAGQSQASLNSIPSYTSPRPTPTHSPPCRRAHTRSAQSSPPDWCRARDRCRSPGDTLASGWCHTLRHHPRYSSSPGCAGSCRCRTRGTDGPRSPRELPPPTPPPSAAGSPYLTPPSRSRCPPRRSDRRWSWGTRCSRRGSIPLFVHVERTHIHLVHWPLVVATLVEAFPHLEAPRRDEDHPLGRRRCLILSGRLPRWRGRMRSA